MSRNLILRILVASIGIPSILWISYEGGGWLFGMVTLLAIGGILEFLRAEGLTTSDSTFWIVLLSVTSASGCIGYTTLIDTSSHVDPAYGIHIASTLAVMSVVIICGILLSTGRESPNRLFERYSRLLWGTAYIVLLFPYLYFLRSNSELLTGTSLQGGDLLLFLFAILWVGDTAAMGIGTKFGRHRLAPTVSPNKTVEGFFGGLLGALVVALVMFFWKFNSVAWYHVVILAVGCSLFGQLGDLVESMWKRSAGIKDSSAVIPGHGGILDRFDSLMFAAPFMYLYISKVMAS